MANQRIKADLIPSCDIYPVIHLAQYDVSDGTGKQVEIELYYGTDKFTIPSGSEGQRETKQVIHMKLLSLLTML